MTDKSRAEIAYDLMMGTLTPVTECPNPSLEHPGNTSDGFHTFDELYDHRMLLNAALFNEWYRAKKRTEGLPREMVMNALGAVVKSKNHSDGQPCFGGDWFIVVAELPTGQISYHYEMKYYDLFRIPQVVLPPEYDDHTPADVVSRLAKFLTPAALPDGP